MSFPCQFPRQGPHREEGMTSLASIEENRPFPWRISGGGTGEKSLHFMPFGQGEAHPKWPGPSEGRFSRCVMCQQCSPLPQAHRSLGLRALWSSLRPGLASGLRYCTLTGFLFLFFFLQIGHECTLVCHQAGLERAAVPLWELCAMCYHLQKIWQRRARKITQQLWILSSSPFSAQFTSFSIWET